MEKRPILINLLAKYLIVFSGASFILLSVSCSGFGSKSGVGAKKDESFQIKHIPKGWSRMKSEKAQFAFSNSTGSVVYANSYCDYYKSKNLESLALAEIKKLGNVQVERQTPMKMDGHRGILSTVYSQYSGKAVLVYNFASLANDCFYELNGITSPTDEIGGDFREFIKGISL